MDILARPCRGGDRTFPCRLHAGFGTGSHDLLPGRKRFHENAGGPRIPPAVAKPMARSRRCIVKPSAIMTGSMTSGIHASGPAMTNRTPKVRSGENAGRGYHAARSEELAYRVKVAELIGNDTDRAPSRQLDGHHVFKIFAARTTSTVLPVTSIMRLRTAPKYKVENDREAQPDR